MPDAIRAMIPRDWLLIMAGYKAQNDRGKPGANAPSREEFEQLVRDYG
jgi:hypothetical protein